MTRPTAPFGRVLTAMVTPFTEDGALDLDRAAAPVEPDGRDAELGRLRPRRGGLPPPLHDPGQRRSRVDRRGVVGDVGDADPHRPRVESLVFVLRRQLDRLAGLEERLAEVPNATLRRKQARQAARAVLPNATESRIVVTGNYRAWRHFVGVRASEHADVEIRELAIACLRELQRVAGNVFGDFRISTLADGTQVAASPLVTEG